MNGTVEGPIVYCNYGMKEDFDRLEQVFKPGGHLKLIYQWDVTLEGAIALIRYAGIPRADKIREAQKRGAVGVVLFSDPLHYTGTDKNRVSRAQKQLKCGSRPSPKISFSRGRTLNVARLSIPMEILSHQDYRR